MCRPPVVSTRQNRANGRLDSRSSAYLAAASCKLKPQTSRRPIGSMANTGGEKRTFF